MTRRSFIKSTIAVAGLSGLPSAAAESSPSLPASNPMREYYELRLYHLRKGPKQKLFDDYFKDVAIPAMNRAGITNVGVFTVLIGPDNPTMYVLLRYPTLEDFSASQARIQADKEYVAAKKEFLDSPASDPAYFGMENQLLASIDGVPRIEIPAAAAKNQPRIFELRTYESHNKAANLKKIEMFNKGELAIFRKNGLQPVFFGEALVGPRLPNLTYLLTFESLAAREKHWAAFASDPEWKKLSTTPGYTDAEIVSRISNLVLKPAAYSQL